MTISMPITDIPSLEMLHLKQPAVEDNLGISFYVVHLGLLMQQMQKCLICFSVIWQSLLFAYIEEDTYFSFTGTKHCLYECKILLNIFMCVFLSMCFCVSDMLHFVTGPILLKMPLQKTLNNTNELIQDLSMTCLFQSVPIFNTTNNSTAKEGQNVVDQCIV